MPKDPVPLDRLLDRNRPDRNRPGRDQSSETAPIRLDLGGSESPLEPPAGPPPERPSSPSTSADARRTRFVVMVTVVLLIGVCALVVLPHLHQKQPQTPLAGPSPVTSATTPAPASPSPSPSPTAKLTPTKPSLMLKKLTAAGPTPSLPWPTSGQAEVDVVGLGVLGHSGPSHALPIASVAKVMTAYTVLRDHPLSAGRSGPTLTVSAAEAAAYPAQKAALDSLVTVSAGEKLTEREALKGLLIASGDNMAEILARWDAGSVPAFVRKMNQNAGRLGMTSTHYVDPHGLSPSTVSTAADLIKLAPAAMAEPTLAELAGTSSASMPLNPQLTNYNTLLGLHGVYGIKTGSTTAAGGCLLFAAHRTVSGHPATIYGAVLGISGSRGSILSNARDASDALVVGAGDSLHRITLIHAGQPVVTLVDKSGARVQFTVAENLTVSGWSGQTFRFALPAALRRGRAPAKLTVHTPTTTLHVRLVKMPVD
jgi:serine-type D-Ala-D-Ala carboxypeptidase (penicillin-binding protein 5/6)